MAYTIKVVDEIADAYEWQNVHVDLSDNALLHRLVVQVWNVGGVESDILFGVAMVLIVSSHNGCLIAMN